jgi:hypothetical protein
MKFISENSLKDVNISATQFFCRTKAAECGGISRAHGLQSQENQGYL